MNSTHVLIGRLPIVEPDIIPVNSQVTVTIGRNVGNVPMSDDYWYDFQSMIYGYLRESLRVGDVFKYGGIGEWNGSEEESFIFVAIENQYPASTKQFGETLSRIAKEFSQDAIAWSFGPNNLAKGN